MNFTRGFSPDDSEFDARMEKDKEKDEGMTNPRPNYVFGLSRTKFNAPRHIDISKDTQCIQDIVPLILDCMFFIEGKSDRGEAAEAENQACRSGAALVNASRMLRERINEPDVKGADSRTFLYSATMSPKIMEI